MFINTALLTDWLLFFIFFGEMLQVDTSTIKDGTLHNQMDTV